MSETIKVLCYKSKTLSNGEHPLMVCVCKDGKRKYQSLGISVKAEWWDFKANLPKGKCPNRERIILLINEKINEIQKAALDKRIAGKDFTAATLIESTSSKDSSHKTVGEYYLTYIQNLKKEKRIRYAGMLEVSYNSFIKFNRHLDIPFSDIDVAWLKKYELWMKGQNLSVSTISTRIRHLRAVFNLAITEHSIKNDCYPFHTYKVSKLNRQTPKRAITKKAPFHQTEVQVANRLHKVLAKVNKHLKEIGERLNLPIPLTTYVARHSYATVLKRAGVSTSIISESLGHSSERVTQIYLDSFDNEQINSAMKYLL